MPRYVPTLRRFLGRYPSGSLGYNPGMETATIIAIGIGIGLAAVAGVRAFLPLLLAGFAANLGLIDLTGILGPLDDGIVLLVLLGLSLTEIILDKFAALDRILDAVLTPVRSIAGGILFMVALTVGTVVGGLWAFVVGAVIAGLVAGLKAFLRPPAGASAGVSDSFLSFLEDLAAGLGGIVAVFVPVISALLVAFLLYFYRRLRRRRGRKYQGLRILGD